MGVFILGMCVALPVPLLGPRLNMQLLSLPLGDPSWYLLEWVTFLLASAFLLGGRRSMAVVYGGFAPALVALLLLIYQDGYTYTADMIIVLNIFWCG